MKFFLFTLFFLSVYISFSLNRKDSLLVFKWEIVSFETEDSTGKKIETKVKGNYYFLFKKKVRLFPFIEKRLQLQLVQNNNCTVRKSTKWKCWVPTTVFYSKKTDSTKSISMYFSGTEEWLIALFQNLPLRGFPAFDLMWRSEGQLTYKNGILIFDVTHDYLGKKKKLKLTCRKKLRKQG